METPAVHAEADNAAAELVVLDEAVAELPVEAELVAKVVEIEVAADNVLNEMLLRIKAAKLLQPKPLHLPNRKRTAMMG